MSLEESEEVDVPPRLVWTEVFTTERQSRINSLPANPQEYISNTTIATRYKYQVANRNFLAIATDFEAKLIFFSDGVSKQIFKGSLDDDEGASVIYKGTSQNVEGIALDWVAKNLYWCDASYDWIIVANYLGENARILVDTGLDKPRDIVVFPQEGYMYWTDWGNTTMISKATLSGDGVNPLVESDLVFPNGLAIDYASRTLYWVDANPSGSRVESFSLDGSNRRRLFSTPAGQAHFFDVTPFQEYLFMTDWHGKLQCINRTSGAFYFNLNLRSRPHGITTYGSGLLPAYPASPCLSNPCDHLCLHDASQEYKCVCGQGYVHNENQTCVRDEGLLIKPQILLLSKTKLCYFPVHFADLVFEDEFEPPCILTERTHSVALAVDVHANWAFFSVSVEEDLSCPSHLEFSGMAVDYINQKLYWTDHRLNHIVVSNYDGSYRITLVDEDVIKPRSIVIHMESRTMFWTEFGPPYQIERADLDGGNRRVIVTLRSNPSGLALDDVTGRLVFGETGSGTIYSYDLVTDTMVSIHTRSRTIPFYDMEIIGDYLIWTEWGSSNGIHALNLETASIHQSQLISEPVYGVRLFGNSKQRANATIDDCGENNGECSQLCVATATGHRCYCSTGFKLGTDGRSCETGALVSNNFALVTDSYEKTIFQVDLSSDSHNFTAIALEGLKNPIAVDYDPVDSKIYFTDVIAKRVVRANLDGTEMEDLAVDYVVDSRLYWCDAKTDMIEASGYDGSDRFVFADLGATAHPFGIGVFGEYIYWTDWLQASLLRANKSQPENDLSPIPIGSGSFLRLNGIAIYSAESALEDSLCPIAVSNGQFPYHCDRMPGAQCSVECDEGYYAAHKNFTCLEGPEWNFPQEYICQAITCPAINATVNAEVSGCFPPHILGTVCRFNCKHGFSYSSGSNDRTCQEDGTWSGEDLFCDITVCPVLPQPKGGLFQPERCTEVVLNSKGTNLYHYVGNNYGATDNSGEVEVTYNLPPPVYLEEGVHLFVQTARDKANNQAVCSYTVNVIVNHCAMLSIPFNSDMNGVCDTHHGATCEFRCNPGFRLVGNSVLTCGNTTDGQFIWDDVAPHCEAILCPEPEIGLGVVREGCAPPYYPEFSCFYLCKRGYENTGGNILQTCQQSGEWTGTPLNCTQLTCPALTAPKNGGINPPECTATGAAAGDACTYSCSEGFQLEGPPQQACSLAGEWMSADAPRTCKDVNGPQFNGTCPHDMVLVASTGEITAVANWESPTVHDREGHVLNISATPEAGTALGEGMHFVVIQAFDDSGNRGSCFFTIEVKVIRCPLHPIPGNAKVQNQTCNDLVNSECTFLCNNGFRLVGSQTRTCQWDGSSEQGSWSGVEPVCEGDRWLHVRGCNFDVDQVPFGSICTLFCEPGYMQVFEGIQMKCSENGTWQGENLECVPVVCEALALKRNSSVLPESCINGTRALGVCSYSCDSGFAIVGPQNRTCSANGVWNYDDQAPTCKDVEPPTFIDCPEDPIIQRSEAVCLSRVILDVSEPSAQDNSGYVTVTNSLQNYYPSGNYSLEFIARDPAGLIAICQIPVQVIVTSCPEVLHRTVESLSCGSLLGSVATFRCSPHERQIGARNATCQADGTWSAPPPTCEAVFCPPLVVTGGIVIANQCPHESAVPGTQCEVLCTLNNLSPRRIVTCSNEDATWRLPDGTSYDPDFWTPHCTDQTPPVITCPPDVIYNLPNDSNVMTVTWPLPTATDNLDTSVDISGPTVPVDLTVGRYIQSYVATDKNGNTDRCTFAVKLLIQDIQDTLNWTEPVFTDTDREHIRVTVNLFAGTAGLQLRKETHTVRGRRRVFECRKMRISYRRHTRSYRRMDRMDVMQFSLASSTCSGNEDAMKVKFMEILQDSIFMDFCNQDSGMFCKMDSLQVECGEETRKKRAADVTGNQANITFVIHAFSNSTLDTFESALNLSVSAFFGPSNPIIELANGFRAELVPEQSMQGMPLVNCTAGEEPFELTCYPPASRNSRRSLIGLSKPQADRNQCQPGEYSHTGLQHCLLCPENMYQPSPGSLGCLPCPEGTFSDRKGSSYASSCRGLEPDIPMTTGIDTTTLSTTTATTTTTTVASSKEITNSVVDMTTTTTKQIPTKKQQPPDEKDKTEKPTKKTEEKEGKEPGKKAAATGGDGKGQKVWMWLVIGVAALLGFLCLLLLVAYISRKRQWAGHRRLYHSEQPFGGNEFENDHNMYETPHKSLEPEVSGSVVAFQNPAFAEVDL
ncbi:putative low-density lipoprotein receptor-related protein 2 [Apostichopus japonicus]|uniref:Putative low-density lipoprotein receptor-related protein 2 n=1 Tax=Stichopus japonicus TaxID=307972 RepID=A0A2G8LH01_STIJA|nr:putative low-density lipoprotein receptor-related protein 2 [Apostichopus japonicus]